MRKEFPRLSALVLAAVFVLTSAACAFAAEPPIPGSSVPFGVDAGTTVAEVVAMWITPGASIGESEQSEALPGDTIAATGMVIRKDNMSAKIFVRGDVLGTGKLSLTQLIRLAQALSGAKPLEGVFDMAGDLNGNGTIDLTDLTMLAGLLAETAGTPSGPSSDVMEIAKVSRRPLTAAHGTDIPAQKAAAGANDFAFRFSASLLSGQESGKNFICSPYSVWLPLAALVNATDEAQVNTLLEAIGAAGLTAKDINDAASRMLYSLTGTGVNDMSLGDDLPKVDPLKIANAVFVDRTKTVTPEFADIFANDYLGESISVDFTSSEAVDAVNQWASDNTDGMIEKIIEDFDPATVAAIANAIYFSDRWEVEFDPDDTKTDVFHGPSADMNSPFMVREGYDLSYYEDEELQAIQLPFRTGGEMTILLPKEEDAQKLLEGLTEQKFQDILRGSVARKGKLLLPRFEFGSDPMGLNSSLEALGVPLLDPANYPITKLLVDSDPLYISQAVQSARIDVDEKGTTAAAVTVLAMEEAGALVPPDTPPFEMNCDHPFVFVLSGHTRDGGSQVLFTGVVNQPEAA